MKREPVGKRPKPAQPLPLWWWESGRRRLFAFLRFASVYNQPIVILQSVQRKAANICDREKRNFQQGSEKWTRCWNQGLSPKKTRGGPGRPVLGAEWVSHRPWAG